MSTVPGDGEIEATQVLSDGDLEEAGRRSTSGSSRPPDDVTENTLVMDDSQLRELVSEEVQAEPDPEQEAAFRKQRDAERAAREREEALARVRAHRRQSANTRALRPAGAPPPDDAKVALSRDALAMLDHEIEPSSPPPSRSEAKPHAEVKEEPSETSRPKRGTVPLRKPRVPPPAPMPELPLSAARAQKLYAAIDSVEAHLRAGDVAAALEVIASIKRG